MSTGGGGKTKSKRYVLRRLLKVAKRTDSGRLLQREGARELKGLAPVLVLILRMDRVIPLFDLSERDGREMAIQGTSPEPGSGSGSSGSPVDGITKVVEKHVQRIFKIIVIGDSKVGKTCLTFRFCGGKFPDKTEATIGVDFRGKTSVAENETIKVLDNVCIMHICIF